MQTTEQDDEVERFEEPEAVAYYLRRLKAEGTWLTVTMGGSGQAFRSLVVSVDAEKGTVVLDELIPRDGNARFTEVAAASINAMLEGAQVEFELDLLKAIGSQDAPGFRCALPGRVVYRQRRKEHRIQIGPRDVFKVSLGLSGYAGLTGQLIDISMSGLCATFTTEKAASLPSATNLDDAWPDGRVVLQVPGEAPIESDCELRFLERARDERTVRAGISFKPMEAALRRTLRQFVMAREREQLKRTRARR